MIKIMSNKKWNKLEQQFVELQLDLGVAIEDNETYKKQVDLLIKDSKAKDERIKGLLEEIDRLNGEKKTSKIRKPRTKKVKEVVNEEEGNNTQR